MSSTGGKATYKGVNAQSWAALSLFLQYVKSANLDYIAFEQDKLKDFDLVFTSGRKIICESKTNRVTHGVLKEILGKLIDNEKVGKEDEILIICKELSSVLESDVENMKYFLEIKDRLKKKGFTNSHLELFSKIKFWKVDQNANEEIVTTLLAEILGVWFPDKIFDEIVSNILISRVYKGSQSSEVFTRNEFYQMIEERKKQVQEDAGYKNEQTEKLERIDQILAAIDKPNSREWCNNQITLLTTTPDLHYLTIIKLGGLSHLNLPQWDNLWKAVAKGTFALNVFDIFQKNVSDSKNQKYLVNFLPKIIEKLVGLYSQEFILVDMVKICSAILEQTRQYDKQIFEILKSLIVLNAKTIFFVKSSDRNEWEQEQTTEALQKLYEKTNGSIKKDISAFIFSFFDLVSDDGQYWHYTPDSIFRILKNYVEDDVESRITLLARELSKQYETFYKRFGRRSIYEGWEHSGFVESDRHFISHILQPILIKYYSNNPDPAWKYVTAKIIKRKENQVTKDSPDFLNRSAVPIIISAYENTLYKDEALAIIKDFVQMRKGIPHKTELIYRQIAGSSLSDEDKWALVKLQLDYKPYGGLPVNKHVKKIVSELANNGHSDALNTLEAWAKNSEFNKFRGALEGNITLNVPGLLANSKTKKRGVAILKEFLESDYFVNMQGLWDVWGTAKVLSQVLVEEFDEGKSIIEKMWSRDMLTKNQQVVMTSSINNLENDDTILTKVYREIVSNWLVDCKDEIDQVIKKFSDTQSRIAIVQFGEKLAKSRQYQAAIRIAKVFINDPDPSLENALDDPEGKHNYHELVKIGEDVNHITTVRASVTWLLQSIGVLHGRSYIPEIIPLVKKLTNDDNYYVRAYSCIPLEQLMTVRHTVLPNNATERFLDIKLAREIESIAYAMLRNKQNWKLEQVLMGILRSFYNVRSINTEEAKEILDIILQTKNYKVIEDARSLFIFFAEFRIKAVDEIKLKYVYSKKRIEELKNFDDKYFKELLIKILTGYPNYVKAGFAWTFWHLPREQGVDFNQCFAIAYKYLSILTEIYDHEVMTNVYYFIEEFYEQKFEECFVLWKKCLTVERPYLLEKITKDNLYDMHWWPFHYNGKILVMIAELKGDCEFMRWTDYLADYPEGAIIANDLVLVIDRLITLPVTDQSKNIFKKLVVRHPEYYEKMKGWLISGNEG